MAPNRIAGSAASYSFAYTNAASSLGMMGGFDSASQRGLCARL